VPEEKIEVVDEIVNIPLDSLYIAKGQVRLRNVNAGIDDLAESIRVMGLLEPILVAPSGQRAGMYEVIAGQRRFLAHERLGLPNIRAIIRKEADEMQVKAISLTENLLRQDVPLADKIDACTQLFKRYGSPKAVAEATGIKEHLVREYLKYDYLDKSLQKQVDDRRLTLKDALRVQRAASVSGKFSEEEASKISTEIANMTKAQGERLIKEREADPSRPLDDVLEEQKTSKAVTQIVVTLLSPTKTQLDAYAKAEDTTLDDAARSLIEEGLSQKGFIESSK